MAKLRCAALTDIGRVRRDNQDYCLLDERLGLFGVADGVGSLPDGAAAARAAAEAVRSAFGALPAGAVPDLRPIVGEANRQVAALGDWAGSGSGPATTLTFGWIRGARLRLAHVGDSRCYTWRSGRMRLLTEDHNVENENRRRRAAGEKVPRVGPHQGAALTRCIGQLPPPEPDLSEHRLADGDRLLFCTDGIDHALPDAEIAAVFTAVRDPVALLERLVETALLCGGWDNVSGVAVFVDEA